jgi:hypothetical protein
MEFLTLSITSNTSQTPSNHHWFKLTNKNSPTSCIQAGNHFIMNGGELHQGTIQELLEQLASQGAAVTNAISSGQNKLVDGKSENHQQAATTATSGKQRANKNSRQPTKPASVAKPSKTVWTTDMIVTLLDKRCDDYAATFALNRSTAQISVLWGKIALAINTLHGTHLESLAVRQKYSALKREFSAIRLAEQSTGNEQVVQYPAYWEEAVSAFGDKEGLGHHDFAFGSSSNWAGENSDSDATSSVASKRQADVDAEINRQRDKRPKKMDISQSLVALGDSLAAGMRSMSRPTTSEDHASNRLLAAIAQLNASVYTNTRTQNNLQVLLEKSTQVQDEVLRFLRKNE